MMYKQCSQCVLDTNDDANIHFDENGICNHCYYCENEKKLFVKEGKEAEDILLKAIAEIKKAGKNQKYDCIIGLSGGVDSSFVALLAYKHGLRPLCFHLDNGWDSELAVQNIHALVSKFGFDLDTYVIDWDEFKDLQLSYLRASVVDIEALTDHAIYGAMFKLAKQKNIKYILGGYNVSTEGVLPYHWTHNKKDYINIQSIHKQFGSGHTRTYPFFKRKLKRAVKNQEIQLINLLNWVSFHPTSAKLELSKYLGWRDYGGKHQESMFTKFYQGFILPHKFGIDKRKAHLSSLICAGFITKQQALALLEKESYQTPELEHDKAFVLKKLGLSEKEFEEIMKLPVRKHTEFDTEGSFFNYYPVFRPLKPLWEKIKAMAPGVILKCNLSFPLLYLQLKNYVGEL